jgi:glycosyltransferase involved in cell wall biosynthesis
MPGQGPVVNVIQDGARLHYALPVALNRLGILGTVFTDWFVRAGSREDIIGRHLRQLSPNLGRRLADRRCPELDSERVCSNYWFTLHEWLARAFIATPEKRDAQLSKRFGRWVGRQDWRGANAMVGFVRNIDPRLCAAAKKRRVVTVVDQMIAPATIQLAEARRQAEQWPYWCNSSSVGNTDLVLDIERRTWALADQITCPSDYVREGLLQQGIPPDRISVIPYPIDNTGFRFIDRRGRVGPPVVGFLGAVGMRKGAPAFIEVASRFDPRKARFVMVGPVQLDARTLAARKGPVELTGAVPRSQVLGWLAQFDVFLFPSTCEGSAGAAMEAMATGLPIITTPNSGTIARHGIEGFICAPHDIPCLAQFLDRLTKNPDLRVRMGMAARDRALSFDLDNYGRSLDRMFRGLLLQQLSLTGALSM